MYVELIRTPVYAMYERSRLVLIILGVALATEAICMSVSLAFGLPKITFNEICSVTFVPTSIIIYGYAHLSVVDICEPMY
jgi:hypothetical protein